MTVMQVFVAALIGILVILSTIVVFANRRR